MFINIRQIELRDTLGSAVISDSGLSLCVCVVSEDSQSLRAHHELAVGLLLENTLTLTRSHTYWIRHSHTLSLKHTHAALDQTLSLKHTDLDQTHSLSQTHTHAALDQTLSHTL